MDAPVYLDYNATTPVAPEVAEAMQPFLGDHFGNPSSGHAYGIDAAQAVTRSRDHVAALIGAAAPEEIVFCGCATEANNLALLGVARALRSTKRHIVVSAVEHPAVMQPALLLQQDGWQVTIVAVNSSGRVDPEAVRAVLRPDTALVSVMHANNETGTIQPVPEIGRIARAQGALMHTDAAQSAGKIAVAVDALEADLLTLAGHKFYAPKGIGVLYVRGGTPIRPLMAGADQEHGLRPGTENVPHIVGLGEAARLARQRLSEASQTLRRLRDHLHTRLAAGVPDLVLNGHPGERLPNTLNVSFPGVSGRALLREAGAAVAASTGAACHSGVTQASGVLGAMGLSVERAAGAVRLSVGIYTRGEDIERAGDALVRAWARLAS
jgi:cysteine desulfurase